MTGKADQIDSGSPPPTLHVIPTIYPTSAPLEDELEHYWELGESFESVDVDIQMPETPLEILEQLGPSPFPRGRFPLIGFLATTYDKVSRYAMERRSFFLELADKSHGDGDGGSSPADLTDRPKDDVEGDPSRESTGE